MNFLLVAPILILLGSVQGRHQQQLRNSEGGVVVKSRKLEQAFDFIVSEAAPALCITAVQGDSAFGSLELASCDFENAPPEQLWRQNGKFVSGIGTDRCMTVNHGNSLFDGVRLRLGYCNSGLTDFTWNDGSADLLRVLNDNSFCLTCTGSTATAGDRILAKPCLNRADYKWTFTAATTSTGDQNDSPFGTLYELYCEANACVQPKNHDDTRAPIILDTCDNGRAWYVKEKGGGRVKFHSAIDPALCLQAGFCSAKDGTWLRLMECDDNSLQDFTWQDYEAPIKLAGSDLCMVYQGSTAEVGDIMVMKDCNVRSYEWSGDAIE